MSLPPLPGPDRQALAAYLATLLHVRSRDGGASARLYLSLLDRDELEAMTLRLVAYLDSLGAPSDAALRGLLLELEAMA